MELKCLKLKFLLSCSSFFLLSPDPNQNTTPQIHKFTYPKISFLKQPKPKIHFSYLIRSFPLAPSSSPNWIQRTPRSSSFSGVFYFSRKEVFFSSSIFLFSRTKVVFFFSSLNKGLLLCLLGFALWNSSLRDPAFHVDYLSTSFENLSLKNSSSLKELEMLLCKIVYKTC